MNTVHWVLIGVLIITSVFLYFKLRHWGNWKNREETNLKQRRKSSVVLHSIYNDRSIQLIISPELPFCKRQTNQSMILQKQDTAFDTRYLAVLSPHDSFYSHRIQRITVLDKQKLTERQLKRLSVDPQTSTVSQMKDAIATFVKLMDDAKLSLSTLDDDPDRSAIELTVGGHSLFNKTLFAAADNKVFYNNQTEPGFTKKKLSLLERKRRETRGYSFLFPETTV